MSENLGCFDGGPFSCVLRCRSSTVYEALQYDALLAVRILLVAEGEDKFIAHRPAVTFCLLSDLE